MANEKRLIDANALKRAARKWERERFGVLRATTVLVGISNAPTIDAEEVIRCRECAYRVYDKVAEEHWCDNPFGLCCVLKDHYYCPFGERKDNAID